MDIVELLFLGGAFGLVIGLLFFVFRASSSSSSSRAPSVPRRAPSRTNTSRASTFARIDDRFETIADVQAALREAQLEGCNLIVAIDYTASNAHQGGRTFGGHPLHEIQPYMKNPYQEVIEIIGRTLESFDDDKLIPVLGFGDVKTRDRSTFRLDTGKPCVGFQEVLSCYCAKTPTINLSGPTSFTPVIRAAMDIVRAEGNSYHILLLITDGQTMTKDLDAQTLVEASSLPLSIVCVGVGDGPFDQMHVFDDEIPAERAFDNFQFVKWEDVAMCGAHRDAQFARMALMEIPEQYTRIRELGLLR